MCPKLLLNSQHHFELLEVNSLPVHLDPSITGSLWGALFLPQGDCSSSVCLGPSYSGVSCGRGAGLPTVTVTPCLHVWAWGSLPTWGTPMRFGACSLETVTLGRWGAFSDSQEWGLSHPQDQARKGAEAVVVGYSPAGDTPAGPAVWTGADSDSTRAIQGLWGPWY